MATKTQTRAPQRAAARPQTRSAPPPRQQTQRTAPTRQEPPRSTEVAVRQGTEMSTDVSKLLAQHAGKGISHAQEDNIVPLVYLLQANSKQCLRGGEKYIEGAGAGFIWLRNASPETCLISGDDGMIFQPSFFSKCWIEWMPERGGFVQRHPQRPEAAEMQEYEDDNGNTRKGWRMPSGNHVVETREYSGFVVDEDLEIPRPYTIPLSGTGHSVGKSWMTSMRDERLPDGSEAPLFANYWRLRTKLRTKGPNSWYQYEVTKECAVESVEAVQRGVALHDSFVAGTKETAGYEEPLDEGGVSEETQGRGGEDDRRDI